MTTVRWVLGAVWAVAGVAISCASAEPAAVSGASVSPLEVTIDQGPVRGVLRHGVVEFRGIPYAGSPAGAHRWGPTPPPPHWTAVRDASAFGPACPQTARFGLTEASDAEDCLTINVSEPADRKAGETLPVLFWIHGGAFLGGSANLYRLDALARQRIVVVSANYRLGVFGFMAHPAFAASDNGAFGLEDQRAAMRWVQRNIAAFGGDPANVTIAGESAGGGSVCQHLAAPERVKGLFSKAIVQSAACMQPLPSVAQGGSLGIRISTDPIVHCGNDAHTLACLRKAPLADLLDAGMTAAGASVMSFGPTIGSTGTPRAFAEAARTGDLVKVPLLLGGTRDELRLYVGYDEQAGRHVTHDNVLEHLRTMYEATPAAQSAHAAERIAREYDVANAASVPATLGTIMSDYTPVVGINNCLYLKTAETYAQFSPTRVFEFADRDAPILGVGMPAHPDPGFEIGAGHSSELNYLFPNLSNTSRIDAPDLSPASQALADQMVVLWANFMRSGVPSAAGVAAWPLYRGGPTAMLLDRGGPVLFDAAQRHKCGFWKSLYPQAL